MENFKVSYQDKDNKEDFGSIVVCAKNATIAKSYIKWLYAMYNCVISVYSTSEDARVFATPDKIKRMNEMKKGL